MSSADVKPPFPPFNEASATLKVRMAENAWNNKDPIKVSMAYSPNSQWRNRCEFINGRAEIQHFLTKKWEKEHGYRLIKELWAYTDNHIAVRFAYEWHDNLGQWYRSYGNENWQFNEQGLMTKRFACINDVLIAEQDRKFHWEQGSRPDDYQSLSQLGL